MAASVSYECTSFFHHVFLHDEMIIPETHHSPPRFMQIELTIDVLLMFIRHDCITGNFTASSTNPFSSQETLRFDLKLLENHNLLHQVLAPTFNRLGINLAFTTIIHEIIEGGLGIVDWAFNRGYNCKVLPLRSVIRSSIVEHVYNQNQGILMRRAMAESASEFGRSNYGMVAAEESSVKEMLKRVRVEVGDEEDCMICLEEIKVGFDASRMPCSHTFHGNCIEKWLKQSHYCPICRFEMPTN